MTEIPAIQSFEEFEAYTERLLLPPVRSHFGAINWRDRKKPRKRLTFLVEDWLTTTGISIIGGRSSSGKSFLALHLALCIARGMEFFGLTVQRCGVVYQAGEGGLGLLDRMEAYSRHFAVPEDEDIPFTLLPRKIDIFTKEKQDVDLFIQEVKQLSERWVEQFGLPAGLITIDTFKKAAPGIDEISGKDNAVVLDNVARIERETKCHVILVHHTNADGKKLRGHTSLRDDVDQVILIEHDKETGIREAVLDKIKDGEDNKRIRFTLIAVPVRTEQLPDGSSKELTSCAVVTVTEKERLKKEQARLGYSLTPTTRKIFLHLFEAQDKFGKFVANDKEGPAAAVGRMIVHWDHYREVALSQTVATEDRKKAADQIRKEFMRNSTDLIRHGVINVEHPYLWWDKKPIRGFRRTFPNNQLPDGESDATMEPPSEGLKEVLASDEEFVL